MLSPREAVLLVDRHQCIVATAAACSGATLQTMLSRQPQVCLAHDFGMCLAEDKRVCYGFLKSWLPDDISACAFY